MPGDTAVSSAYLKQIGSQVYSYDFARTRLSPKNATGGTDLYSRNFSWAAGLVNLPGRAGLDAGMGISYNSLVWTKDGSTMVFDADKSNVSPGFRFGFPVIEPVYLDSATGKYNYLMVTPSGAKVEFKQAAATDIYETADSGYTQLVLDRLGTPTAPVDTLSITVTTTDGTQMSYAWIGNAYRCTQIKDRNGNIITIGNDEYGLLKTITDTLGRVINVNYDMDNNPISITQNWKDNNGSGSTQLHTYASFNYTNVAMYPSFATGISIYGPATGTVKALQSIVYPGGSSTRFDYNVFGQVYKISDYAADNHELNRTRVNLSNGDLPSAQADCPRFSQTMRYVENFNQDAGGTAQEVVINNSITENSSYSLPGGINGTATKIEVSMPSHPNGAVSKTYVGAAGWQEGLPVATEDFADGARKRWTWTNWTQDDPNLSYIQNPRVLESKVGDTTNVKRTTVDYGVGDTLRYGLVSEVKVYDTDQSTVLKRSTTAYNLSAAYTSRRIIGLPAQSQLLDGSDNLLSKVTYAYDEGDFTTDTTITQNLTSVIQHDHSSKGYGASFVIGRGNLTSTTRHDVTGQTSAVTSSVKYNTAGAVVSQTTPDSAVGAARTVRISYADVFNDNLNNRNTFAYPTTLTDPAGYSSQVKYRYDTGANVRAQSPAPQNQTQGKISERLFDQVGRLERQIVVNTGAYTRYEYPANGVQAKMFATITSGLGEAVSESWTDGAGRVRQARSELPDSAGGWSATLVEYDILGRIKRSSVPTEVDANWNPAGDDLTRGFLWTANEYDWKGRLTREVNTDGTDKLVSYEGCGCAGGQVTTIQGELVPRDDQPTQNARRIQKIYADILGREYKTEFLNWDGITPYTTTVQTFNGRDQVTQIRQYAGDVASQNYQDETVTYDGHGRIWKTHKPEQQNSNGTPAYTTYAYNSDDSVQSVTDARGAAANYTYNNLGLVGQVTYFVPQGSTIPVTPTNVYSYDALGNRTQMIDESGTTTYQYNQLSQIISETKQFSGLSDLFTLNYEYALNGSVKKMDIMPNNTSVSYNYDKIGRVNSVSGQGFWLETTPITNIASNIEYRAWNSVKVIDYGSSLTMSLSYDNNLKVSSFRIPAFMEMDYQYNADGKVKFVDNLLDGRHDRSYSYDQMQRLVAAKTGEQANGGTNMTGPYNQSFGFDTFNNSTSRNTIHWTEGFNFQSSYTKNRRNGWIYDAAGNVTDFDGIKNTLDAAEMNTKITYPDRVEGDPPEYTYVAKSEKVQNYDGDGQTAIEYSQTDKHKYNGAVYVQHDSHSENKEYNLKSTVLGGAIVFKYSSSSSWWRNGPNTQTSAGSEYKTNLFLHGKLLAVMTWDPSSDPNYSHNFEWRHTDPMATTLGTSGLDYKQLTAALDPVGASVGFENPYIAPNPPPPPLPFHGEFATPEATEMVEVDGVLTPLYMFPGMASIISQCPRSGCGPQRTENGWEWWSAFADGYEGYLPMGGHYAGGGRWSWQDDKTRKQDKKRPTIKRPTKAEQAADRKRAMEDPREIVDEMYITPFDREGIREGIRVAWGNTDCRDTVLGLLNAVASKSNPLVEGGDMVRLFDLLMTQRGERLTRKPVPGSAGYGSVSGSFGNGNASVTAPAVTPYTPQGQLTADIGYVFNELMHLAGRNGTYFDRDFSDEIRANPVWANSAKKITLRSSPNYETLTYPLAVPGLTSKQKESLNNPGDGPWSEYFHSVVNYNCFR